MLKRELLAQMEIPFNYDDYTGNVQARPKDYMHFHSREEEESYKPQQQKVIERLRREYPGKFKE